VATITAINGASAVATGVLNVVPLSPALFTADSSGLGLAEAVALRVRADGTQSYEPIVRLNASNRPVAVPIDLGGEGDRVFLLLFGTGLRKRGEPTQVKAQIGGADAEVSYAGPQGDLVGLDQINLLIPRSLQGRGNVEITLTVDSRVANPVRVDVK
jgi:uncharacterized protein (TIGR03437 family)